ncbi:hypothetical protein BJX62DRAFT_194704 [Aspergillus germanicus]
MCTARPLMHTGSHAHASPKLIRFFSLIFGVAHWPSRPLGLCQSAPGVKLNSTFESAERKLHNTGHQRFSIFLSPRAWIGDCQSE